MTTNFPSRGRHPVELFSFGAKPMDSVELVAASYGSASVWNSTRTYSRHGYFVWKSARNVWVVSYVIQSIPTYSKTSPVTHLLISNRTAIAPNCECDSLALQPVHKTKCKTWRKTLRVIFLTAGFFHPPNGFWRELSEEGERQTKYRCACVPGKIKSTPEKVNWWFISSKNTTGASIWQGHIERRKCISNTNKNKIAKVDVEKPTCNFDQMPLKKWRRRVSCTLPSTFQNIEKEVTSWRIVTLVIIKNTQRVDEKQVCTCSEHCWRSNVRVWPLDVSHASASLHCCCYVAKTEGERWASSGHITPLLPAKPPTHPLLSQPKKFWTLAKLVTPDVPPTDFITERKRERKRCLSVMKSEGETSRRCRLSQQHLDFQGEKLSTKRHRQDP